MPHLSYLNGKNCVPKCSHISTYHWTWVESYWSQNFISFRWKYQLIFFLSFDSFPKAIYIWSPLNTAIEGRRIDLTIFVNDCLKKLFFKKYTFFEAGIHQLFLWQILPLTSQGVFFNQHWSNLVGKDFENKSKD